MPRLSSAPTIYRVVALSIVIAVLGSYAAVREAGSLSLVIHDNGVGFDEGTLRLGRSLGILGMRERAVLLGGELTIQSVSGEGTTVNVRIPEANRRSEGVTS